MCVCRKLVMTKCAPEVYTEKNEGKFVRNYGFTTEEFVYDVYARTNLCVFVRARAHGACSDRRIRSVTATKMWFVLKDTMHRWIYERAEWKLAEYYMEQETGECMSLFNGQMETGASTQSFTLNWRHTKVLEDGLKILNWSTTPSSSVTDWLRFKLRQT